MARSNAERERTSHHVVSLNTPHRRTFVRAQIVQNHMNGLVGHGTVFDAIKEANEFFRVAFRSAGAKHNAIEHPQGRIQAGGP